MKTTIKVLPVALLVFLVSAAAWGQTIPTSVNYQGRVMQSGSPYSGQGFFKFAICDSTGTTTYWSNDLSSSGCAEPAAAVGLTVNNGLYNVGLGDSSITNMNPLPSSVFQNVDAQLTVWFGDTSTSLEALTPAQPLTSVPYSMNSDLLQGKSPAQLKEPNVIIVDPAGNGDAVSIADGLSIAAADFAPVKLKVAPGEYYEANLMVPPNTIIECLTPRQCLIDPMGADALLLSGSPGVRITGFTFQNYMNAILLSGGESDLWIQDNTFTQGSVGIRLTDGPGLPVYNLVIRDNFFTAPAGPSDYYGIWLGPVSTYYVVLIANNEFFDFASSNNNIGVYVAFGYFVRVVDNFFEYFSTGNMGSSGITCINCTNIAIERNTLYDFSGNAQTGISVMGSQVVKVRNNLIEFFLAMTSTAISSESCSDLWIEDNIVMYISGDLSKAIEVKDTSWLWIVDNLIQSIGMDEMYGPMNQGIEYYHQGMAMGSINSIIIKNNQLNSVHNGIKVDFQMAPESVDLNGNFSVKTIEGNQITASSYMDQSYGTGIEILDAENLQVSSNTVRDFSSGALFTYITTTMPILEFYRNQIKYSQTTNVTINMPMPGTIRSYYNLIGDSVTLPGVNYVRPPWTIDAYNLDANGLAP